MGHVRPMTLGDVPAVAAIEETAQTTPATLAEELSRPWARLWVAGSSSDAPEAFLSAWHVADEVHVLNVATRAEARRRGLGERLVRFCVQYAKTNLCRCVLLEVRIGNAAAIALYRKVGFVATNVRRRYYPDGEDGLEMALRIDPASGETLAGIDEIDVAAYLETRRERG